jgi:hypothetical protein
MVTEKENCIAAVCPKDALSSPQDLSYIAKKIVIQMLIAK